MIYVDASAVVKLVIEEPESRALRDLLAGKPDQVASTLIEVEVPRAVARRVPEAREQAMLVVGQIDCVELDPSIRAQAAVLGPPLLRAIDALHVATALRIREHLEAVVTYDARMAEALRAVGMEVLAPT